jgi:hypothetical protein
MKTRNIKTKRKTRSLKTKKKSRSPTRIILRRSPVQQPGAQLNPKPSFTCRLL